MIGCSRGKGRSPSDQWPPPIWGRVSASAARAAVVLQIGFMRRFDAGFLDARARVEAGAGEELAEILVTGAGGGEEREDAAVGEGELVGLIGPNGSPMTWASVSGGEVRDDLIEGARRSVSRMIALSATAP